MPQQYVASTINSFSYVLLVNLSFFAACIIPSAVVIYKVGIIDGVKVNEIIQDDLAASEGRDAEQAIGAGKDSAKRLRWNHTTEISRTAAFFIFFAHELMTGPVYLIALIGAYTGNVRSRGLLLWQGLTWPNT